MRFVGSRPLIGLLVLTGAALASAQGPPTRTISLTPSCATCTISAQRLVRLSDATAGFSGGKLNLTVIDRDSRGRYFIADYGSRTTVVVFDAQGKLLKKIGREGSGPGEFRHVGIVFVGPGDTVHAVDVSGARRSVISPDKLEVVRQVPWPSTNFNVALLPNGRILTSGADAGGSGFGHPFHEMSPKGERLRSFGAEPGKTHIRWMNPWLGRRLVPTGPDRFIAIQRRNYVIEEWTSSGAVTARWRTDWKEFPVSEPVQQLPETEDGLAPEVVAAWRDTSGHLFVVSHVRQANWRRAIRQVRSEGRIVASIDDFDGYWDTVIDVFDLQNRRLLATRRFDEYFDGPAGKGDLFIKSDDPEDIIEIWRVRFVRR